MIARAELWHASQVAGIILLALAISVVFAMLAELSNISGPARWLGSCWNSSCSSTGWIRYLTKLVLCAPCNVSRWHRERAREREKQRGLEAERASSRYVVSDVEVETAWRASAADEEAAWRAPKALHSNADEVTPVYSCDEVDLSQVTVSEGGVVRQGRIHAWQ